MNTILTNANNEFINDTYNVAHTRYSVLDIYNADTNKDGILDKKEAKNAKIPRDHFRLIDRFDGKQNSKIDIKAINEKQIAILKNEKEIMRNNILSLYGCDANEDGIVTFDEAAEKNYPIDLFRELDKKDDHEDNNVFIRKIIFGQQNKVVKISAHIRELENLYNTENK